MTSPDVAALRTHVVASCPGTEVLEDEGSLFFVHPSSANKVPFATVTVSDKYDPGSDLSARGLWRLNVGIGLEAYKARFGKPPALPKDGGPVATGHDFRAVDAWMPHPVYAAMGWVCIVAPSPARRAEVEALIALAYQEAGGPPPPIQGPARLYTPLSSQNCRAFGTDAGMWPPPSGKHLRVRG